MDHETWRSASDTVLPDGKNWRHTHPTATFLDMEDAVHRQMVQRDAHLRRVVAEERSSRAEGEPQRCPTFQGRSKPETCILAPCQATGESTSPFLEPLEPARPVGSVFPWMKEEHTRRVAMRADGAVVPLTGGARSGWFC